eukprot:4046560-Pleurochrysis_carterae.AAC.1
MVRHAYPPRRAALGRSLASWPARRTCTISCAFWKTQNTQLVPRQIENSIAWKARDVKGHRHSKICEMFRQRVSQLEGHRSNDGYDVPIVAQKQRALAKGINKGAFEKRSNKCTGHDVEHVLLLVAASGPGSLAQR